jgi:hypothetical protein
VTDITDPLAGRAQKVRSRWDAASAPRIVDHALLVRDPGPSVIRNGKGCRALRRRADGLGAGPAARIPPH